MRRWWLAIALLVLASACAETERCPDGQVFDGTGRCVPISEFDAGTDGG